MGALVAIGGGITVGELSVLLNYANQYTKPFNDISGVMTELQNALACAQRVFDFIDEDPILPDAPMPLPCPTVQAVWSLSMSSSAMCRMCP